MSGQEIAEQVDELNNDFSVRHISAFLEETGLMAGDKGCTVESCEKFVFLHGDSNEVYNVKERKFIEGVGDIFVYSDFYRKTKRGNMPCRFIAVDLSWNPDDIYAAVFFMKIVVKAIGGFTIFVIKLSDGVHLGVRLFDSKEEWKNCALSEPDKLPDILDEVTLESESEWFLRYYNTFAEAVKPVARYVDYDEMILRKRAIQFGYIDSLYEIERKYGESVQTELQRYIDFFQNELGKGFAEILEEIVEELRDIQSSKVNTIEMLFEADELERVTTEAEESRNKGLEGLYENRQSENDSGLIEEMKSNPEALIKKLKRIRGLI